MRRSRTVLSFSAAVLLVLGLAAAPRSPQAASDAPEFDVLIRNGLVLDGSLREPFRADV
ncbi:MAG: D-aminoacylase, partial [Candidatus Aminicenantes bacterium]